MIYLIDFENVHEEGFSALGRLGDKDAVYCFFTRNVAKISMSALAGIRSGQLHFIEAESGKQSLDLVLVSYLGFLIGTKPQELYYDIISNDNGFSKVADFWNKRGNGLRVRIRKTNDLKPKTDMKTTAQSVSGKPESKQIPSQPNLQVKDQEDTAAPSSSSVQPENAPESEVSVSAEKTEMRQDDTRRMSSKRSGRQRTMRQRGTKQDTAKPASVRTEIAEESSQSENISTEAMKEPLSVPAAVPEVQSVQRAGIKAVDPSVLSSLEAVGINAATAEFLQLQVEKYRTDKNVKQLVYRAVVKKYGQKNGTQIYNSAKKILLK